MLIKESKAMDLTFQGLRWEKIKRIIPRMMAVAEIITVAAIIFPIKANTAHTHTIIATIHCAYGFPSFTSET